MQVDFVPTHPRNFLAALCRQRQQFDDPPVRVTNLTGRQDSLISVHRRKEPGPVSFPETVWKDPLTGRLFKANLGQLPS